MSLFIPPVFCGDVNRTTHMTYGLEQRFQDFQVQRSSREGRLRSIDVAGRMIHPASLLADFHFSPRLYGVLGGKLFVRAYAHRPGSAAALL